MLDEFLNADFVHFNLGEKLLMILQVLSVYSSSILFVIEFERGRSRRLRMLPRPFRIMSMMSCHPLCLIVISSMCIVLLRFECY